MQVRYELKWRVDLRKMCVIDTLTCLLTRQCSTEVSSGTWRVCRTFWRGFTVIAFVREIERKVLRESCLCRGGLSKAKQVG